MMRTLFVNTKPAQCSIYQSGKMIYEAIKDTDSFTFEYCEINELNIESLYNGKIVINDQAKPDYDYYIFFILSSIGGINFYSVSIFSSKFLLYLKFSFVLDVEIFYSRRLNSKSTNYIIFCLSYSFIFNILYFIKSRFTI